MRLVCRSFYLTAWWHKSCICGEYTVIGKICALFKNKCWIILGDLVAEIFSTITIMKFTPTPFSYMLQHTPTMVGPPTHTHIFSPLIREVSGALSPASRVYKPRQIRISSQSNLDFHSFHCTREGNHQIYIKVCLNFNNFEQFEFKK